MSRQHLVEHVAVVISTNCHLAVAVIGFHLLPEPGGEDRGIEVEPLDELLHQGWL